MQPRERERVHASLPVEFSNDAVAGTGRVVNLAVSGCEIASDTVPPVETSLTLQLQVPRQPDPLIVALAVVRWTRGTHFGTEFVRFEGAAGDQLRRLVALLEPAE